MSKVYLIDPKDIKTMTIQNGKVLGIKLKRKYKNGDRKFIQFSDDKE